jgi:hypothetical protein
MERSVTATVSALLLIGLELLNLLTTRQFRALRHRLDPDPRRSLLAAHGPLWWVAFRDVRGGGCIAFGIALLVAVRIW